MRAVTFALMAMASAGCAHQPTATFTGVTVDLGSPGCFPQATPAVPLRIRNSSGERIAFYSYGASDPPYELHPGAAQLLSAPTMEPWQVVLEHFAPATHQVALRPGDHADFVYEPSVWPSAQEPGIFRLQVQDTRGRLHYSPDKSMCHPGATPASP